MTDNQETPDLRAKLMKTQNLIEQIKSSDRSVVSRTSKQLKILIVTSEMPSHIFATAKMAKVCAARGHQVTFVTPDVDSLATIILLTRGYSRISCQQVGFCRPVQQHVSERRAIDPYSWTTLWEALQNPYPMANAITNCLYKPQDGMYEPLRRLLARQEFDMIIPIHSVAPVVCDAAESLPGVRTKIMVLNSLPYDPGFHEHILKVWETCIPALPHVMAYGGNNRASLRLLVLLKQMFWMFVDAVLRYRAWIHAGVEINEMRAERGLSPLPHGLVSYFHRYPVLSFGGMGVFMDKQMKLPLHVTPIGALDAGEDIFSRKPTMQLQSWLDRNRNFAFVGLGTGTILSDKEASNIAGDLVKKLGKFRGLKCGCSSVLFALRKSEQLRLRSVFDAAIGSAPTSSSRTHLEYLHGRLRIEANVPQAALLKSGRVRIFVSHMGMGAFTEGVAGAVPFACYPSGCDQWYNTERAIEANIGVRVPFGMDGIGDIVANALANTDMDAACEREAQNLRKMNGNRRTLDAVEKYAAAPSLFDYLHNSE